MDRSKNEIIGEEFMRKTIDKAREGISKVQTPYDLLRRDESTEAP